MQTQSSRPMQKSGKEVAVPSRDRSASASDAGRDEVGRQLDLAMQSVARRPASGHQAVGQRPAEFLDAAQQEVLEIQESLVAARAHARAHAAVEAAGRIANGTYGICQTCGEKISQRRLQAVPLTRFCLACQEAREQRSRGRYRLDRGDE